MSGNLKNWILWPLYLRLYVLLRRSAPVSSPAVEENPTRPPTAAIEEVPAPATGGGIQAESALLMGEEYNTMVNNIMDMGWVEKSDGRFFNN